jgi:hypothetical protein
MDYAALPDLRAYRKIATTNTSDDALLTSLLARAQALIERETGLVFEAAADTTRYFDPTRDAEDGLLYLDYPLAQITSITNGDGHVFAVSEYTTEPRRGAPYWGIRLRSALGLAWNWDSALAPDAAIAIVGRWAYAVSAPADIVQATIEMALYLYTLKDAGPGDAIGINAEGGVVVAKGIPDTVARVLRNYRGART